MKNFLKKYSHWNWALLDQGLVSGVNFLLGILLVRHLGVEKYGVYVLAWMVVQFILGIQNALIAAPMMSIGPKMEEHKRSLYYAGTINMQIALAAAVFLVSILSSFLVVFFDFNWLPLRVLLGLSFCLVFVQFQDYLRRNLFSRALNKEAFFIDVVACGGQLIFAGFILNKTTSVEFVLGAISFSMFAAVVVGARLLTFQWVAMNELVGSFKRHWKSSRWLVGSTLLQWLSGNYFMIVAAALLGPIAVGAIRAAQNLFGLSHIVFQALENIVPRESSLRYRSKGIASLRSYTQNLSFLLFSITAALAAAVAVFAEPLLVITYGKFDASSLTAMMWYVPIYTLLAATLPLRAGLRTLEQTRAIFIAYVVGAVFSLISANYFVEKYMINGVMSGILLNQIITTLILVFAFLSKLRSESLDVKVN